MNQYNMDQRDMDQHNQYIKEKTALTKQYMDIGMSEDDAGYVAEEELKDIEQYNEYTEEKATLKAEFLRNGMSEYEAEEEADDMAWNLAYCLPEMLKALDK